MNFAKIGIILFVYYGCTKEETTNYSATLINKTQHLITILPYKTGLVVETDTIKLPPNQQMLIASGSDRGLVSSPGFSSKYFGGPDDSIIVIYDNVFKITHYANAPSHLAPKYYVFTSLRNIGNPQSYRFETRDISKHIRENKLFYEFAEQDYLDAK